MTEQLRNSSPSSTSNSGNYPKMDTDLGPRKTMLVLVIVVGCFAVLWPKVFYPMLVGSANQHIKPSAIDKTTGCCDVISEIDVNTIKIMSELCGSIIKHNQDEQLNDKEIFTRCRRQILEICGIDISVILQEQVRLGQNVKEILNEIRSLNGSLCLKYNFGVAPWRLGVPHRVTINLSATPNIRQERPLHLRSELIHPAFRERGRAIPQPQPALPTRPPPRIVEGRPGPVPGMRPTIGGAGHVVPPSKQGTSNMSVIMPIYTIGIVIFFTYTLMKILFKKQPEGPGGSLYPPVEPDPLFRKEVFESEQNRLAPRLGRDVSSKLGDAELDQLRQRLRETELAMERIVQQMSKVPLKAQDLVNGLSNGSAVKSTQQETVDEQPSVHVLGMEMTASCEGGKKWSRSNSPILQPVAPVVEPVLPPQEIYLEGALPAQSHLLVADSATEPQPSPEGEDPAVVLAGKMTLSVISLDSSENGTNEKETTENGQEREAIIEDVDSPKIDEENEEPIIESKELEKTKEQTPEIEENQENKPEIITDRDLINDEEQIREELKEFEEIENELQDKEAIIEQKNIEIKSEDLNDVIDNLIEEAENVVNDELKNEISINEDDEHNTLDSVDEINSELDLKIEDKLEQNEDLIDKEIEAILNENQKDEVQKQISTEISNNINSNEDNELKEVVEEEINEPIIVPKTETSPLLPLQSTEITNNEETNYKINDSLLDEIDKEIIKENKPIINDIKDELVEENLKIEENELKSTENQQEQHGNIIVDVYEQIIKNKQEETDEQETDNLVATNDEFEQLNNNKIEEEESQINNNLDKTDKDNEQLDNRQQSIIDQTTQNDNNGNNSNKNDDEEEEEIVVEEVEIDSGDEEGEEEIIEEIVYLDSDEDGDGNAEVNEIISRGLLGDHGLDESAYTNVTNSSAPEHDIAEEEITDDEEVDEEELLDEEIDGEEVNEVNNVNHITTNEPGSQH